MTVTYVEREQADATTLAFYDKAEQRFEYSKSRTTERSPLPLGALPFGFVPKV